jgi:subtilisin family serine protease
MATVGLSLTIAGSAFAESYLVVAKGHKFGKNLVTNIEAAGGRVVHIMDKVGVATFNSDDPDFALRVERIKGVHLISGNPTVQLIGEETVELISAEGDEPPLTGDDDFYFDAQWGHTPVQAIDTWAKGYRGTGVRVAVLDSGIDADHPDLAPNLNVGLSASFVPGEPFDVGILDPGPSFNHGSHVAGTIGAADNAFGTIGVAPEVELVAVKVLSQFSGSGSFGGVYAGMVYAADIDADVINMSLGGALPRSCGQGSGSRADGCQALVTAGNRVANYVRQQGTLIIASAGNSARDFNKDKDLMEIPNDLPGVVSISAMSPSGWAADPLNADFYNLAGYSNFGTSGVSFAAPGGDVYQYPTNELCPPISGLVRPCWLWDAVFSTVNGSWGWAQGTSMAAPHATGVAALIIGANGGHGSMTPSEVIEAMKAGADDVGKSGKDHESGHGHVNAYNSTP